MNETEEDKKGKVLRLVTGKDACPFEDAEDEK